MLNSSMKLANKAICYAEVINMYSLRELFNSTPVHNTPQWYIQCTLVLVRYFLPVERNESVRK